MLVTDSGEIIATVSIEELVLFNIFETITVYSRTG